MSGMPKYHNPDFDTTVWTPHWGPVGSHPADLARVWLTGDCPMYVEGCRTNHLCQHCLENAQVDFGVDDR